MKALYEGVCVVCDGKIEIGSAISPSPTGEYVHSRHTYGKTCPTCFMTRTPSGACGCDE